MREIKFRAWGYWRSKIIKRNGEEISMQDKQEMFIPKKDEWLDAFFRRLRHSCLKWELLQFTGLKDKNGKEIFEGNIIACRDGKYVIEYIESFAKFVMTNKDIIRTPEQLCEQDADTCMRSIEVIGNKFENLGLLK